MWAIENFWNRMWHDQMYILEGVGSEEDGLQPELQRRIRRK